MIWRLVRWLRVTLPNPVFVWSVLLVLLLIEGLRQILSNNPQDIQELTRIRDSLLICTAFVYGVYRHVMFFPLYSTAYREWLALTPWRLGHPLPRGPVTPVVQDALIISLLMGCRWDSPLSVLYLPLLAWLGYLLAHVMTFLVLGQRYTAYLLLFLCSLPFLEIRRPEWAIGELSLAMVVCLWGLRLSLSRFPWELAPESDPRYWSKPANTQPIEKQKCGWPWDHLAPTRRYWVMHWFESLCIAYLTGWFVFVCMCVEDVVRVIQAVPFIPDVYVVFFFIPMFLGFGIIGKLASYSSSLAPPISSWGRLRTFRWIIPGHDKIFVGPLLAMGMVVAGFLLMQARVVPLQVTVPVMVGFYMFILLTSRPTRKEWELTGHHRLTTAEYKLARPQFLEL